MDINWAAVAGATLLGVVVGNLWFNPRTFFPVWWKAMGRDPDEKPGGPNMAIVLGGTFVAIFVQALILAAVLSALVGANVWTGLALGALLGVLTAAVTVTHKLFGGMSLWAWLMEAGSDVVGLALMGLTIGLFLEEVAPQKFRHARVARMLSLWDSFQGSKRQTLVFGSLPGCA